jgi:hypothetical protein
MTAILAAAAVSAAIATCGTDTAALRAQSQALLDSYASGNQAIWQKVMTPDAVSVDENGTITNRKDFIAQIRPLPANISGAIAITDYQAHIDGDAATVVHHDDERETYHGLKLRAGYIMTETWLCRDGQWKLALLHAYVDRKDPPAIALPSAELDEYAGRYAAAPDLNVTIRRDGDHLEIQRDGKPAQTLQVELRDVLFIPGEPRDKRLFQRDSKGKVTSFIDRREGEDIVWGRNE